MTTKKADYIWFNGEMVRWEDAKVHVMSHALHYGTSVFEGSVATTLTKGQWCSAIANTCSVCMTQPKFIVSRSPKALMS